MNATERRKLCFGLMSTCGFALLVAAAFFRVSAPPPAPANFPTNIVVDLSQIRRLSGMTGLSPIQWQVIEPAERINLQIMRRYQERWNRFEKLQSPFQSTLPGGYGEGK
jgi:hypothetical protein